MTKLIVQIPCYNEAGSLTETVADIPRKIDGIDVVEVLIIDDGSIDDTIEVAKAAGVDHIVRNKSNKGLARTFSHGLKACLERGADIIVNTDGDNQYSGASIIDLVKPILEGRADIVVGDRGTSEIEHFSPLKKRLQSLGSAVVRQLSGLDVADAVSGFRAYSREAAMRTNVVSNFSYTVETLIQAGNSDMTVLSVPVDTNPQLRESRLAKSMSSFIRKQVLTMIRSYAMYRALHFFTLVSLILIGVGLLPIIRFLILFMIGEGQGNIQSLILGGVLIVLGVITFAVALLADAVAVSRKLQEQTLEAVRRMELATMEPPTGAPKPRARKTPAKRTAKVET